MLGMRRLIFWTTSVLLLATLALGLLLAYLVLVPTTRATVQVEVMRAGLQSQALTRVERDNSVHYGVHLLLGRALALYPPTRRLADWQYYKARWHARTRYQRALVTTDRPHSAAAAVSDAFGLGISGLKWLGGRVF